MCIIVYKPKKKTIDDRFMEHMKSCEAHNPDGFGYMYPENGKVVIRKGFFTWPVIEKELRKLMDKKVNMVFHFRLATHGTINRQNCHPFPISGEVKHLLSVKGEWDMGAVHNGIITWCSPIKKSTLSDSQIFIRDYLSTLSTNVLKNEAILELIYEATKDKFAFMFPDEVKLVGKFIEDKGIFYSNTTYKQKRTTFKDDYMNYGGETVATVSPLECELCWMPSEKLTQVIDPEDMDEMYVCEHCYKNYYFQCYECGMVMPVELEAMGIDHVCQMCYDLAFWELHNNQGGNNDVS